MFALLYPLATLPRLGGTTHRRGCWGAVLESPSSDAPPERSGERAVQRAAYGAVTPPQAYHAAAAYAFVTVGAHLLRVSVARQGSVAGSKGSDHSQGIRGAEACSCSGSICDVARGPANGVATTHVRYVHAAAVHQVPKLCARAHTAHGQASVRQARLPDSSSDMITCTAPDNTRQQQQHKQRTRKRHVSSVELLFVSCLALVTAISSRRHLSHRRGHHAIVCAIAAACITSSTIPTACGWAVDVSIKHAGLRRCLAVTALTGRSRRGRRR